MADIVPNETDIADNLFVGGYVMVTIPGDVDADFVGGHFNVSIYDAAKLLSRYGAKEGNPGYNPICDIDNDGRIYLYDAVILLSHYGQKY